MATEVVQKTVNQDGKVSWEVLEKVLVGGDLSKLNSRERVSFLKNLCESLGLNYLSQPFKFMTLNGRLVLYATKDATEQLRKLRGISIERVTTKTELDLYIVEVKATEAKTGRVDFATGIVPIKGLTGNDLANSMLKCETKAKRRATLSICGLGFLDETEVSTIKSAQPIDVNMKTGEIEENPLDAETMKKANGLHNKIKAAMEARNMERSEKLELCERFGWDNSKLAEVLKVEL